MDGVNWLTLCNFRGVIEVLLMSEGNCLFTHIVKSSDICTSIRRQPWWQLCVSLFLLVKNNG